MENGKVTAQTGDYATAINQLNRFQAAPLNTQSIAPLALIRLGEYLRIQKRAPEAVNLLTQVRTQQAQALLADPARAAWVPTSEYESGLAPKDAGQCSEARAAVDQLPKPLPRG